MDIKIIFFIIFGLIIVWVINNFFSFFHALAAAVILGFCAHIYWTKLRLVK